MEKSEKKYTLFYNGKPKDWDGFIMLYKTEKQTEKFRSQCPDPVGLKVGEITITYEVEDGLL
jgi:hypothetical protein